MNPNPKVTRADSEVTTCVMLTAHGDKCGKPGQLGLPAGICVQHALAVFRAVNKMISAEQAKVAS
ncbi:hypothetical protein BAY59_24355 [Prauserella coralliicola]|nr:hypothetical protein BAY59_24355 [Prauserella coralliicola]